MVVVECRHSPIFYLALLLHRQVDCITVSLFPFKASIEDQLQRLADALTLSLRNSVLSNFKTIDTFLEDSMDKLGRRPRTISDISEVHMRLGLILRRFTIVLLQWHGHVHPAYDKRDRGMLRVALIARCKGFFSAAAPSRPRCGVHGTLPAWLRTGNSR